MALTKQTEVDKIEVVGEFKHVQVREATKIIEDGNVISVSYARHVVAPGDNFGEEDPVVQTICASLHTEAVINAYQDHLAQQAEYA